MKSWWWYPPSHWSGWLPSSGSDEYGRHTTVIPTLIFGTFVIARGACDCEDMADFRCLTPECPWLAMVAGGKCGVCDPWDER